MQEKSKTVTKSVKEQRTSKKNWIKDIPLTSLGWDLAIPIFGGVFLGYQLDRALGTKYLFSLMLLIFGIFIGYFNLYRIIELEILRSKSSRHHTNEKERYS